MLICTLAILLRWGNQRVSGENPVGLFTFMAILFTSGLDMGLVILPLTEFPTYAEDSTYAFANPLAVEFGFWGFLIWSFYFVTTFYFVALEPRVKIFEIPAIKVIHNLVIVATCAFTAYLFLVNISWYLPQLERIHRWALIGLILLGAVVSSTDLKFVKRLSLASTGLFFSLIAIMWFALREPIHGIASAVVPVSEYFTHLHRFVLPMSDYHAFYLFWWFSWSLMIGQFVARFLGGLKVYQLLLALLVVPSIPLAIWFAVLYRYYLRDEPLGISWKVLMVTVGILFVVNSVDSLVRLYSENTGLTVKRLGKSGYIAFHFALMVTLVVLFTFTPLEIEWVGLVVIGLFAATGLILVKRRARVGQPTVAPQLDDI